MKEQQFAGQVEQEPKPPETPPQQELYKEQQFAGQVAVTGQVEVTGQVKQEPKPPETPPQQELTPEQLRQKLRDPNFLPTRKQITNAFQTLDQWINFCFKENQVFEFLNEEYLNALAHYFVGKIQEYGASKERPLVILEIGAGNGRLSHFLRQKLEERAPGQTKVVATDSGAWNLKSDFPVEQLKHDEAMKKYNPDIVVISWMPYNTDLSKDIRKFDSVQEYILIGESDGGCCGDPWETWGINWLDDKAGQMPPYKAEGFVRENLHNLSLLQICRSDEPGRYYHSNTVSFKRGR
jgi:hypothetical protein